MMRTVGITAEYNPFHRGHVYHAQAARQMSGADCVIAVMSGDFTQRGESALCGKWERAEAAVRSGAVDLVVELPFAFACSRASVFAAGAVDMLAAMGAGSISFGAEAEEPMRLEILAESLTAEASAIEEAREEFLKAGYAGAKAYELAAAQVCGKDAAELLHEPNNILAVEYLKRILKWRQEGRELAAYPVKRHGSGYAQASEETRFAGAGALRRMLREGEDISRFLPAGMDPQGLKAADIRYAEEQYLQLLKGILLRSSAPEISRICGVGEGMESAIIREARRAERLEDLVSALTSRRYTAATVRRALTHILVGTGWEEIDRLTGRSPGAGRLLAAGERGRAFLRTRGEGFADGFRIVTNCNKEEGLLAEADAELLKLDERAADIYNLLCGRDIYASSDRVRTPYIAKE